jgi:hypothetical protein
LEVKFSCDKSVIPLAAVAGVEDTPDDVSVVAEEEGGVVLVVVVVVVFEGVFETGVFGAG